MQLPTSVNRYRLLCFAEYASVSIAVLGAIATLSTQQLAYAIAPLSISLALNLASRRQQEQRLTQTIAQVNQRLDKVNQQSKLLQQNLSALTRASQQQAAYPAAANAPTETLQALESQLNQRLQTLSDQIQTIQQGLEQHSQQMSRFARLSSFEDLVANLHWVQTSLNNISAQVEAHLEQRLQSLTQRQQQELDQRQSTLARSVTNLESDVTQLRRDLARLR